MSVLVHCIYSSVQTHPLSAAEIAKLVQDSCIRNKQRGITGILLHVEDTFFQVLEGDSATIDELYDKILIDPRHKRITKIISEPIAKRFFDDISMTLASLTPQEFTALIQDDNPEGRERLLDGLDEGRAKRLLRAFNDGRWRAHVGTAPASVVRA